MFMELIRSLSKINKRDISIAGGKGASLGEMINVGIPVPPGFVITANAFERFLEESRLHASIDTILHSINYRYLFTISLVF